MSPDIQPLYSTKTAAHAAGIPVERLLAWLDRGAFKLAPVDTDTTGIGIRREWCLKSVRRLAIMAALTKASIALNRANTAATNYMVRAETLNPTFRNFASIEANGTVKILSIDRQRNFEDQFDDLVGSGVALTIVDVSRLCARVDATLQSIGTN